MSPLKVWQLAVLIFPESTSGRTATQRLRRWICGDPELAERLRMLGYRKGNKFFTPRQAREIIRMIG